MSFSNTDERLHLETTKDALDAQSLSQLGYVQTLTRNRKLSTLLFQSLAISCTPFGLGSPILSTIYGGGQLSLFIGWVVVVVFAQAMALSIGELASRYPTSAGPYYWSFQIASRGKTTVSFITGWIWIVGNWTITLAVNFGFAALIAASVTMYYPDFIATDWQIVLIVFAILLLAFIVCSTCNRYLPLIDTFCAAWTALTMIAVCIGLSVQAKAGRHDVKTALIHYDTSLSGWGDFTFFIGLLPSAYIYSALGMLTSMAEETESPSVVVPRAMALAVPVQGLSALFFILPICFTLPPLDEILEAPYGQALPTMFRLIMGSPGGAMALLVIILILTLCCSISITTAASRATWAFARDRAIPLSRLFGHVNPKLGVPLWALGLVSIVQALLALINLGSSSAFTAFVSVGVMALECSYLIPILISMLHGRREVNGARFNCDPIWGRIVNSVAVAWISFHLVLFSMPTVIPVTPVSMNYSSVVFAGFASMGAVWYFVHARKVYIGPPVSDGIED